VWRIVQVSGDEGGVIKVWDLNYDDEVDHMQVLQHFVWFVGLNVS